MNIKDIHINPNNPRYIRDERYQKLKKSLQEFPKMMKLRPIVIDDKGMILGGNMRYLAMIDLGYKEIPEGWVVKASELTEEERKRFIIADNVELGNFNYDILANEWDLEELQEWGIELSELDEAIFNEEDIEDDYDIEKATEEIRKPTSKYGDLYRLGNHKLCCGDATKKEDIEKLMNGEKANMVFTDPPYGIKYYSPGGLDNKPLKIRQEREVKGDNLRLEDFVKLIEYSFNNLREFTKSGSPIYICCNYKSFSFFEQQLLKNDFHISAIIIWVKNNTTTPLGTAGDYAHKNEWIIKSKKRPKKAQPIIYGWKEGKHYFSETILEADVWELKRRASNKMIHPTQKPIALINKAITNSSKPKDIILDLFGGSGTTLISCERLNRICRINEIDPLYCDVIINRWENYTGKKAVKINGKK